MRSRLRAMRASRSRSYAAPASASEDPDASEPSGSTFSAPTAGDSP